MNMYKNKIFTICQSNFEDMFFPNICSPLPITIYNLNLVEISMAENVHFTKNKLYVLLRISVFVYNM